MSRFAFGSQQFDGFDPTTNSGFNGFPFPIPQGTTGTKISFDQLAKWWWRVKDWKIVSCGFNTTPAGGPTVSFPTGVMINNWSQPDETSNYLTPPGGRYVQQNAFPFNGNPPPPLYQGVLNTNLFSNALLGITVQVDWTKAPPDAYVTPDFTGEATAGSGFQTTDGDIGFTNNPSGATGSFNVVWDGVSFLVYYVVDPGVTYTAGDIVIDPNSYWPYTNLALADLYDTTNGNMIGNPFDYP